MHGISMYRISETTADGVSEMLFTLDGVPGVLWTPAGATGPHPLVLLGHGGGQHKKAPGLVSRAHRYVTTHGFAVAAIDAPAHGDRPETEEHRQHVTAIRERSAAAEPIGPLMPGYNTTMAAQAVPEWRATLDALQDLAIIGADGPVGYWGVSMGGAVGIPFVAAEPRITAAVFGLVRHDLIAEAAGTITIPVEFLLQWDDEMVPRESGLALFDEFASAEKTLHANTGGHRDVPAFELESSARFFARHLLVRQPHFAA
jgi:dienelactone hydrolase